MNKTVDSQALTEKQASGEHGKSKRLLFIVDIDQQKSLGLVLRDGLFRALELSGSQHEINLACLYRNVSDRGILNQLLDSDEQSRINVHLVLKDTHRLAPAMMSQVCLNAYIIFEWLKANADLFDIVHAYDADNCLYFSMLSKKLGLHFTDLAFLLIGNTPRLLVHDLQQSPVDSFVDFAGIFMDRQTLEMADHVVFGSDDLLQWHLQQGQIDLESKCLVIAPLVADKYCTAQATKTSNQFRYFTVLGDLQADAGLLFYLDGFKRLIRAADSGKVDLSDIKFRFVCDRPVPKSDLRLIGDLFKQGNYKWEVIHSDLFEYASTNRSQETCFLLPPNRVGPGLLEISLLLQGNAFIGFEKSGLDALLDRSSIRHLIRAHPHDLSVAMIEWLSGKAERLQACHDNAATLKCYDGWYQNFTWTRNQGINAEPAITLVSVCIAHFNRPIDLSKALDSIARQDYRNIEVIVVDDGSTLPAAIDYLKKLEQMEFAFPIRVFYQPNLYLGASRNLAAGHANGDFLLFMDDDNLAKPNEVNLFLQAAEYTDADILTCFADAFVEDTEVDNGKARNRIVFSGADIASGLFRNPYGDSNSFVRKSSFEALGGFSEDYKVGRDDQEFFSRAILKGFQLYVVPEALYWYKINTSRMRQTQFSQYAGLHRVARAYFNESGLAPHWLDILRYAQGLAALRYGVTGKGLGRFTRNNRLRLLAYRYPQLFKWLQPILRKLF